MLDWSVTWHGEHVSNFFASSEAVSRRRQEAKDIMCGIAAMYAFDSRAPLPDRESVTRMCARMQCRGPDGSGISSEDDGRVVLGHQRLAIIDLSSGGAQPMRRSAVRLAITFNGEIYNYRALRRELETKGFAFQSDSDTEVLLHLYADRGAEMVKALRGMFAFALWDDKAKGLLLARDSFGIKPLYYANDGQCIRVASEVKALLASGGVDTAAEPAGHAGFFLWGSVPEPFTLYRGVRALPAGSTLWVDREGQGPVTAYSDIGAQLAAIEQREGPTLGRNEMRERLREALLDSVRHHLVADVDVGVFLSAGLDSNTLVALASEVAGRLRTVTLGFEEYRGTERDETVIAEAMARRYGTDHRTVWITREEFRRELPRFLDRMDQPSIDGVNTYFVARAAAETGLRVALSGLGGDELFGGYPSFRQIPRLLSFTRRVPSNRQIGKGLRLLSAPLLKLASYPKYAGVLEYGADVEGAYLLRRALFLPWELSSVLDPDIVWSGMRDLATEERLKSSVRSIHTDRFQISALEASWYMRNQLLRDTDWASMSHSLEVRVPLVDVPLWQEVATMAKSAEGLNKRGMASTVQPPLPPELLNRPKTGFHVPTREWMTDRSGAGRRGLRGWARFVYEAAAAA